MDGVTIQAIIILMDGVIIISVVVVTMDGEIQAEEVMDGANKTMDGEEEDLRRSQVYKMIGEIQEVIMDGEEKEETIMAGEIQEEIMAGETLWEQVVKVKAVDGVKAITIAGEEGQLTIMDGETIKVEDQD